MPNRIIKESICRSDEINSLSWFEEVLFYRLMVNCDDYGRFDGREKVIKGSCFPLKDIKDSDLVKALKALSSKGLIIRYEAEGKTVIQLKTWEKHQQIRSKRSKYPAPDGECVNVISDDITCDQMISDDSICPRNPIQSNTESESESNTKYTRFVPPTVPEVQAYCLERKNNVNAEQFVDFYTSKGWKVGNNPMKDWKACVRTWERNRKDTPISTTSNAKIHNFQERKYDYAALERMLVEN